MKKIIKAIITMSLALLMLVTSTPVSAASANAKAMKAYKKFLASHVSTYKVSEGDWYSTNSENYKYSSYFMTVNLDGKGVKELICIHETGYKMETAYVYTYKSGSVKKIGSIDLNCNAAGYYTYYKCNKGHFHTKWTNGNSYTSVAYKLKNGKLKTCMDGFVDYNTFTFGFGENGYTVTQSTFEKDWKKHKNAGNMMKNNAKNRKKLK